MGKSFKMKGVNFDQESSTKSLEKDKMRTTAMNVGSESEGEDEAQGLTKV